MLRKGFTLIELLIVITIIAILAGAAIPFVQDYVEDARITKARADLDEIKNGLIRYELDTGKLWSTADTTLDKLVGPYLAKAIIDPWGSTYEIRAADSVVISNGPDRTVNTSDDIAVDFRPPLALSKVFWIDADKNGAVNDNDELKVRFTREPDDTLVIDANVEISLDDGATWTDFGTLGTLAATQSTSDPRDFIMSFTGATFIPGRDLMRVTSAVLDVCSAPYGPNPSKENGVLLKGL